MTEIFYGAIGFACVALVVAIVTVQISILKKFGLLEYAKALLGILIVISCISFACYAFGIFIKVAIVK